MNSVKILATTTLLLTASACSRDYAPDPKASGEEIFQAACSECHQPDEQGIIFTLNSKNANPTYIAHKIRTGTFSMPKFPNIKAPDIKKLSTYLLSHTATEKD